MTNFSPKDDNNFKNKSRGGKPWRPKREWAPKDGDNKVKPIKRNYPTHKHLSSEHVMHEQAQRNDSPAPNPKVTTTNHEQQPQAPIGANSNPRARQDGFKRKFYDRGEASYQGRPHGQGYPPRKPSFQHRKPRDYAYQGQDQESCERPSSHFGRQNHRYEGPRRDYGQNYNRNYDRPNYDRPRQFDNSYEKPFNENSEQDSSGWQKPRGDNYQQRRYYPNPRGSENFRSSPYQRGPRKPYPARERQFYRNDKSDTFSDHQQQGQPLSQDSFNRNRQDDHRQGRPNFTAEDRRFDRPRPKNDRPFRATSFRPSDSPVPTEDNFTKTDDYGNYPLRQKRHFTQANKKRIPNPNHNKVANDDDAKSGDS